MNSFVFVYHSGKNTWSLLFEITSWTREFDSASWIRVHLSRPLQHKQDYNSPPVFFLEQHLQEKERHYKKAISGNRWRRGRVLSDKDKKDVWGLSLGGIFPLSSCLHRQHTCTDTERRRKKSSSCLIHLTLDTYKVQLKAQAATIPPFLLPALLSRSPGGAQAWLTSLIPSLPAGASERWEWKANEVLPLALDMVQVHGLLSFF